MVPGVVAAVDDPDRLGRVKVKFDWQDDAPESYWARVAAPMAGNGRGAFFMPEVNDEVLVAFEQGSTTMPYVVGYLWSKPDKPPEGSTQTKRCIKTVLGHELLFDDDSSSAQISLKTAGGHQLALDDAGNKITIRTPDSVAVELDATSGGGPSVKISLPTGNSVTLDATGLTVNAPVGQLNVTAMAVTLNATSLMVNAPVTTFSGLVTVGGALVTTSVVSPTYTPGAGNLV